MPCHSTGMRATSFQYASVGVSSSWPTKMSVSRSLLSSGQLAERRRQSDETDGRSLSCCSRHMIIPLIAPDGPYTTTMESVFAIPELVDHILQHVSGVW